MSLWSVLGKVGSAVGKTALGVVGKVTGNPSLVNTFDKKPSPTSSVVVAAAPSLPMQPVYPSVMANTPVNITATPLSSGLPSWLLPAGIAAVIVLLLAKR